MNMIKQALPPNPNMDLEPPSDPKQCHKTTEFLQSHLNPYDKSSNSEAYDEDDYNQARGGNVKCQAQ